MSTLYVTDKHVHMGFVAFRRRLDQSNCTRRLKPKGTRGPCRKTRYRTLTATCCRVFHGYQAERCLAGGSISVEAHKDVIILTALSSTLRIHRRTVPFPKLRESDRKEHVYYAEDFSRNPVSSALYRNVFILQTMRIKFSSITNLSKILVQVV